MEFTILEKRRYLIPSEVRTMPRKVKDYEIDYNYAGGRILHVDGTDYPISRGDICFRKPGQLAYSSGIQNSYLLTVDFTNIRKAEHYNRDIPGSLQPLSEMELLQDLPVLIHPADPDYFSQIFTDIAAQPHRNSSTTHLLFQELLCLINACVLRNRYLEEKTSDRPVDLIQQYLTAHYREAITLDTLAALVHLEKNYLIRIFKKEFGQTPIEYQISQRMYHARYLMLHSTLSVKEVGEYCGYKTPALFIRHFKRTFQKTPLEYRRQ